MSTPSDKDEIAEVEALLRYPKTFPSYWGSWIEVPVHTREQAYAVEQLRQTHTWRAVASVWNTRCQGTWASNQEAGRDICNKAAILLGKPLGTDLYEPNDASRWDIIEK